MDCAQATGKHYLLHQQVPTLIKGFAYPNEEALKGEYKCLTIVVSR